MRMDPSAYFKPNEFRVRRSGRVTWISTLLAAWTMAGVRKTDEGTQKSGAVSRGSNIFSYLPEVKKVMEAKGKNHRAAQRLVKGEKL
jgi:hypothetical protein